MKKPKKKKTRISGNLKYILKRDIEENSEKFELSFWKNNKEIEYKWYNWNTDKIFEWDNEWGSSIGDEDFNFGPIVLEIW